MSFNQPKLTNRPSELHNRIKELRIKHYFTQKDIADVLGVDVTTYAHYEKGDRTPDAKKLAKLAEYYHLNDEMLGASFPIETLLVYKKEDKARLREVLNNCKWRKGDYSFNKKQYEMLKDAVKPLIETQEAALRFPDVDTSGLVPPQTVMTTQIDLEGERLINEYMRTIEEFWNMM